MEEERKSKYRKGTIEETIKISKFMEENRKKIEGKMSRYAASKYIAKKLDLPFLTADKTRRVAGAINLRFTQKRKWGGQKKTVQPCPIQISDMLVVLEGLFSLYIKFGEPIPNNLCIIKENLERIYEAQKMKSS